MAVRRNFLKLLFLLIILTLSLDLHAKKKKTKEELNKEKKIGKNVLDYNDADVYRLLDQWNDDEDEEDRYDDDDPRREEMRKMPAFDPTQFQGDPMAMLKMAKKNKVLMIFVNVAGNPTRKEAEKITGRWQQDLFNAHYQIQRYMVADHRAIFMVQDGSMAWDIKDYLIKQKECSLVEFDNQKFPGAGASEEEKRKTEL